MPKTGSVKHTHKYHRRADGRWACAGKDGCTHYMPKNMEPAPAGHLSDCWSCDKPFQLTPANMINSKPVCDDCGDIRETIEEYTERRLKEGLAENKKKDPYAAFRTRARQSKVPEVDQIEVIPEDEEHAPECEVHIGKECDCK